MNDSALPENDPVAKEPSEAQPSSSEESSSSSDSPQSIDAPAGRSFPIVGATIIIVAVLAALVAHLLADRIDFQKANIITYVTIAVVYFTAVITYVTRPSRARRARLAVGCLALLLPMALFALFRVDGVTGELVPRFRFRWTERPDEQLPQIEKSLSDASSLHLDATEHDFTEFLGPGRHNHLKVAIATDWEAHPPVLKWRRQIGAGWCGFTTRGRFAVTMEQRGPKELVTCYSIETGEPVWSHAVNTRYESAIGGIGPRATPTWDEDRVYAQGATGILRAIDGRTGKLLWQVNILKEYGITPEEDVASVTWGRSGSPLVVGDLVVVPYGGPPQGRRYSLAAYDKRTGKRVWRGGDRQVSYASPVLRTLCGVEQIVSVNENNVSGHDPKTGKVLWQADWPGNSNTKPSVSQPVVLPGDRVLLSKAYGGGAKLIHVQRQGDQWAVKSLWADHRLLKTKFTNVTIFGKHAFGLCDGILQCVDWEAGKSLWKSRKGRYRQGQILGLSNVILVQAEAGYVALVEPSPKGFREIARLEALQGQTWNNACYAPPYLIVRNATEAACYEVPMLEATSPDVTPASPAP